MNKIYRVIWSKAQNTWIAVSEIAKSQGKSHSQTVSKSGYMATEEKKATADSLRHRSVLSVAILISVCALGLVDTNTAYATGSIYINDGTNNTNCGTATENTTINLGLLSLLNLEAVLGLLFNTTSSACNITDSSLPTPQNQTNDVLFYRTPGTGIGDPQNISVGGDAYINGSLFLDGVNVGSTISSLSTGLSSGLSSISSGLSDVVSSVSAVSSGLSDTNSTVSTLSSGLSTTNSIVSSISSGLSDTNVSLSAVSSNLSNVSSGLSTTNSVVSTLSSGLSDTNSTVSTLSSGLSDTNSTVSTLSSEPVKKSV